MSKPELESQVPFFFEQFLGKPASALPKGAQWILTFDGAFSDGSTGQSGGQRDFEILPVDTIKRCIKFEPQKWLINDAIDATLIKDYQQTKGCMFAQAVQIPSEGIVANPEGIQSNSFIQSYLGGGRNAFETLKITFLETNISFVDNVIRPWVITTGHLGMIARSGKDQNYRCNITVYKLGVLSPSESPSILQSYTFYGACPIDVSGEEYNYTQVSAPINRETTFVYHYYSLNTIDGNTILQTATNNKIPDLQFSTAKGGVFGTQDRRRENVTSTGVPIPS